MSNTFESEVRQTLAEIIGVIVLFGEKIELLKVKLAGHDDFRPQQGFYFVDCQRKGYITTEDLCSFLDNKVQTDVLRLFVQSSTQHKDRLTYLQFLRMIQPYFDRLLAQTLLSKRLNKQIKEEDPFQTLIEHIVIMNCIMFAELNSLKRSLAARYLLNPLEIREIITGGSDKMLHSKEHDKILIAFAASCGYAVESDKSKYLESYVGRQVDLYDDRIIRYMFIPTYLNEKTENIQKQFRKTKPSNKQCYLDKILGGTKISMPKTEQPQSVHPHKDLSMLLDSQVSVPKTKLDFVASQLKEPGRQPDRVVLEFDKDLTPIRPQNQTVPNIEVLDEFLLSRPDVDRHSHWSNSAKKQLSQIKLVQPNQFCQAYSILDAFIGNGRMKEEFTDSIQSSSKSQNPFNMI